MTGRGDRWSALRPAPPRAGQVGLRGRDGGERGWNEGGGVNLVDTAKKLRYYRGEKRREKEEFNIKE